MSLSRSLLFSGKAVNYPGTTAQYITSAFTPSANSLLLVFVAMMVDDGGGDVGQPTISGGGLTYTPISSVVLTDAWGTRLTVFRADVGSSPSSMVVIVDDDDNQAIYGYTLEIVEYTGHDVSTPIGGLVTSGTSDIGDGSETRTLSAAPTSADETLLCTCIDTDTTPNDASLATGWTELSDQGAPSGGVGVTLAYRTGSTSTTVSITDVYTNSGPFYKAGLLAFVVRADQNIYVSPAASVMTAECVSPGVSVDQNTYVSPAAAVMTAECVSPVVVISSPIPDLGEGDTSGFLLWMLSHSYYQNLVVPGIAGSIPEPSASNATTWGSVFFT